MQMAQFGIPLETSQSGREDAVNSSDSEGLQARGDEREKEETWKDKHGGNQR